MTWEENTTGLGTLDIGVEILVLLLTCWVVLFNLLPIFMPLPYHLLNGSFFCFIVFYFHRVAKYDLVLFLP